jgi:NADPH2:quinone reductase
MKFVEVPQFGGTEALKIHEAPDLTPQPGQVVIDVRAAGINFADIMAREGIYPNVKSAPFRPGYEVAGVVTAVGDGVEGFSGGERVMAMLGGMGGYASQAAFSATDAIRLPDTLDFGTATALLVQGLTAYFLLEAGASASGKSVLIPGARAESDRSRSRSRSSKGRER